MVFSKGGNNVNCLRCKGTGIYDDPETGLQLKCNCKTPENSSLLKDNVSDGNITGVNIGKGIVESMGFTNATNEAAYVNGAVPLHRKDDCFSVDYLREYAAKSIEKGGWVLNGLEERYIPTLSNIYLSILKGEPVRKSYLITSHNGFGKTTFANTCIKKLFEQGKRVVPYLSLYDIYNIINAEKYLVMLNKSYISKAIDRALSVDADGDVYGTVEDKRTMEEAARVFKKHSLDQLLKDYNNFEFGYSDFVNADLMFTSISENMFNDVEVPLLKVLLQERSKRGRATVVFGDRALKDYMYSGELYGVWSDIIAGNDFDVTKLDRLNYIGCYKNRGNNR